MCGRFTITLTIGLPERFGVTKPEIEMEPRYNIAPSQPVPVVTRTEGGERHLMEMVWGLIPSWTKDPAVIRHAINARADTLAERPSFRKPLLNQRCLVPANGFYEWKKSGKKSVPHYIHRKDDALVAIAGLYDLWRSPDGSIKKTFVIVTTDPNPLVSHYHDRMPAMLRPEYEETWLLPRPLDANTLRAILTPYPAEELEAYVVSRRVNDPANEGKELIRKYGEETLPV
jgi:putative SOS response-associated peptidase YedK